MNKSRVFALIGLALVSGFLAAHWSVAQSTVQTSTRATATDDAFGLHQLESFVTYLQDTKQTNVLKRFNDYSNAFIASQMSAEMGVRTAILLRLRDGRTNEAIRMLESQLAGDAVGFVASYRALPDSVRETVSLRSLKSARDYCNRFHVKESHPDLDQIVSNAFALLNDNNATK